MTAVRCSTLQFLKGALATGLLMTSSIAGAQSSDIYGLRGESISVTAGVNLTIPLGAQRKNNAADKARLGFKLSAARQYESRHLEISNIVKTDILDFGLKLDDGTPSLMLAGQDWSGPMFNPLFERQLPGSLESGDTTNIGTAGKIGIGVGVALVVVAGVGVLVILAHNGD